MKKLLKYGFYIVASLTIILLGSGDGLSAEIAISLWLLLFLFFACLAFVASAFGLVHWVKHGNPFLQDQVEPQYHIIRREEEKKKAKKLCPVCKVPSRCHVRRAAAGYWYHVLIK